MIVFGVNFRLIRLWFRIAMVSPGLFVRVQNFETIIGRQAETHAFTMRAQEMCRIFVLNGTFRGAAATP